MDDHKPEIIVTVNRGEENERQHAFSKSFRIGRGEDCDVQILNTVVSAHHVEILSENGSWWIHDLHSTNGTFLDGDLIHKTLLNERATIQLGKGGPLVSLRLKNYNNDGKGKLSKGLLGTMVRALPSATQILRHYFSRTLPKNAGQYTLYLRSALNLAMKKKSKKFLLSLAAVSIIATSSLLLVWWQQQRLSKLEPLGVDIFYTMKALELQMAELSDRVANSTDPEISNAVETMRQKYQVMQKEYDNYVEQLGIYDERVDETERLILKVARTFGECELNAPPGFVSEVKKYIKKWQATDRLQNALGRSLAYGYHKVIAEEFLALHLPPQFMYLALQESDLDVSRTGPKTRYGIAKGMWQFIPRTAAAYGLKIGPLRNYPRMDPRDERHNFEKSTKAAARLIHDLYKTKAQGSGLLVLASYNWGIGNLQEILDRMPSHPRERNFWNLVKKHQIPKQTYEFVLYIVSAAVIGENPALFGFPFKNLLEEIS
jgi:pSer/pThr/pTyr-binding forkhead associated (FHA) protein